jgi:HTH-type transcriptional regulator / antitoxin HipB
MTPRQMGLRLKRLREAQGLSQYAMADKAGISRQYVRKLEAGLSDPTLGMLQRIAKALGVRVTKLID